MKIKNRKLDHLRICNEQNVETGAAGFDVVRLAHRALPEIDYDSIDLSIKFLGKRLDYPLIIEAMTGGVPEAEKINKDIASVAQEYNIGFGVGSQRAAVDDLKLAETFQVRDVAPGILLIANLGAVQLNYGYSLKECLAAVDMIEADALALHINPLQEAVQLEGNRNFRGLAEKINSISAKMSKPVIAKEIGCGISLETAKMLKVAAYDVGGVGGTSWSLVEGIRAGVKDLGAGKTFASWGIPTAESVREVSKTKIPVIASGGIRTGIDAAKSLALGASCVGMALPVLRAWSAGGKQGVRELLDKFFCELQVAMFLTGSGNIKELRGKIRE